MTWRRVQKAEARGQGVRQCMRTAAYDLDQWGAPALLNAPERRETKLLRNKKLSDVMESLIGIVFEAAGVRVCMRWMEHFGILPRSEQVRLQVPCCTIPNPTTQNPYRSSDNHHMIVCERAGNKFQVTEML